MENGSQRSETIERILWFSHLYFLAAGLMDYDAALKLDPNNQHLTEDTQRIRELVQGSHPS